MDKKLIDFINDNEELIDNNVWEELYKKAISKFEPESVGKLTTIFLDANIHPEGYLSELPECFLYNVSIENFDIPDNIKTVGSAAFAYSTLKSVVIPDSVTSIKGSAFKYCSNLTSVTIPNSVKSISYESFAYCGSLTSVVIPDGVTMIGKYAFYACSSITKVVIGKNVKRISNYAFEDCGDIVIEFKGTKSEWMEMYNSYGFQDTYFTVYCTDGKIVERKR